jgi:UDP-N-acetylmuramate dehydrogenase
MKSYTNIITKLGKNRVLTDEILASYTTIKLGGPADLFFQAETTEDLVNAVKTAQQNKVKYFVMSGGTNLIISDKGFRGLVIRNKTSNIRPTKMTGGTKTDKVFLKVDSGVFVNRLVRYALDDGLAGLEYFLGQPGAVGGALWINAHNMKAGKKYFGDHVVEAELLDKKGQVSKVARSYFKFGYDQSEIQDTGDIVLNVTLELEKGDKKKLWEYAKKVLDYRRDTQPLNIPSSGCSFRNISPEQAEQIGTGDIISAGYLVDSVGLKGKRIGGAMFSDKHAAFILNTDNAKASDVKTLLDLAKKKIKDKYGIKINEEVVLVGDF